jgi:fatty acid desaturase
VDTRPISHYARALKEVLPPELFAPVRSRLLWFALHLGVAAGGIAVIASGWGGLAARILSSLLVGVSFGGLAFVGHETLHGAVVRGRVRHLIGWFCFLPFMLSPRHWVAWHNRVHHGHAMAVGVDPDAYPTLEAYQESWILRAVDRFSLGRWRLLGGLSLLLGFTGQSLQTFWRSGKQFLGREYRRALVEHLAGVAVWVTLALLLGPAGFFWAYVVPILIANTVVMAHILTNHSLSPLTEVNDPLLNSLTVTTPRLVSLYTLDFGLHVEHHIFPAMSSRHAPHVRDAVLRLWPDRYQSMPILTALGRLLRTARVYKTPTTLTCPTSRKEFPVLLPRVAAQSSSLSPQ